MLLKRKLTLLISSVLRIKTALEQHYKETREFYDMKAEEVEVLPVGEKSSLAARAEVVARNIQNYLVLAQLNNMLLVNIDRKIYN